MLKLSRFATNQSGTAAVLFSLALVPAVTAVGVAVDYTRVQSARATLQASADAAALSAGLDTTGASDATLQTKAASAVQSYFPAGSPVTVNNVGLATRNGNIVVTVNSSMRTLFSGLVGAATVNTTTIAAVPKRSGQKLDIEFLLDASASMGLAATAAGRDQLYAAVGCAFACHMLDPGQTVTNLQVARNLGIQTRIDVLQAAVGGMIGQLRSTQGPLDQFRVGIDTFDDTPHNAVPLTADLVSAQNYIQNYQLGNNTSFSSAMPTYTTDVGVQGDGFSTPKKYAIIVTDGVQGRRDRVGGFHPFDSTLCDPIKQRGVTVIVLNTQYVPMPSEAPYQQTVMPIQNQLAPALQACASPNFYFSATDQADINAAFQQIFSVIEARLRLVQ
ncbi:MAG: hypothetical protein KGM42_19385 [Hyphomicrobiales bacterium]|nr:hypothetical protein [Hyphomicrobiales bacterium]